MIGHHIIDLLRSALVHYGYWAVAAGLLLEKKLFGRYGAPTIFFLLCAIRLWTACDGWTDGGSLAHAVEEIRRFQLLGAALWVTVIAFVGYISGCRWHRLVYFMKRFDLALGAAFVSVLHSLVVRPPAGNFEIALERVS